MKSLHNLRQLCSSLHLRQEGITRYIGWLLIIGALLAIETATDHCSTLHLGMKALQPRLASSQSVKHVALAALVIFLLVPTIYYGLCALLRPMRQLVRDCCQTMESRTAAKHITFETHLSEKLSALEVDKDLLSVVLMNLLSHALKYTPAGEGIVLAEETDAEMPIHLRDSGIGITEADLARIFERFYRGGNTGQTSGSGLGLALAQQIAHLHGGSITMTRQAQQGSQYRLTLPKPQRVPQLVGTGKSPYEDSDH